MKSERYDLDNVGVGVEYLEVTLSYNVRKLNNTQLLDTFKIE